MKLKKYFMNYLHLLFYIFIYKVKSLEIIPNRNPKLNITKIKLTQKIFVLRSLI